MSDFSSEESETVGNSDEEDAGEYFVFDGDFEPFQGEPLASSEDDVESRTMAPTRKTWKMIFCYRFLRSVLVSCNTRICFRFFHHTVFKSSLFYRQM